MAISISRALRNVAGVGALLLLPSLAAARPVYDEAPVLSAEPVYRTVTERVPREVCHEEEVAYQSAGRRRSYTGPILGAIIGGAVGNAVGNGKSNRRVGTAVGAVLGGSIGADVTRGRTDGPVRYRTEEVCQVVDDIREDERLVGYDVRYQYGGETYRTHTQRHPGDTLRVKVRVAPAE